MNTFENGGTVSVISINVHDNGMVTRCFFIVIHKFLMSNINYIYDFFMMPVCIT